MAPQFSIKNYFSRHDFSDFRMIWGDVHNLNDFYYLPRLVEWKTFPEWGM